VAPLLFTAGGVWNAPLAASAPIDPRSAVLRGELVRQLSIGSPWINTSEFSTPIYTVGRDQPRVKVVLDNDHAPLQRAWLDVPVPAGARPAAGSDRHLVVHQPATDTLWEFWQFRWRGGAWHARWGGRMDRVSDNPGYFSGALAGWGATATGLPLVGGLITLDDLSAGSIDHALALAIPQARKGVWRWPAHRTDGSLDSAGAIPEGTRFRLDPRLDIAALRLPWLIRLMAEAAQRYGIVVRDQAGNVTFFAEDSTRLGRDVYYGSKGYFGGSYPNLLLDRFPWQHLQVVRAPEYAA
jgi:hypothetical protein